MAKKKTMQRGPGGKHPGNPYPMQLDQLRKKRNHLIAAMMRGALAGDAECGRLCFELIGDLPLPDLRVESSSSESVGVGDV